MISGLDRRQQVVTRGPGAYRWLLVFLIISQMTSSNGASSTIVPFTDGQFVGSSWRPTDGGGAPGEPTANGKTRDTEGKPRT